MDGYAIRFADLPGPWRVTGESAAGRPFAGTVATGEAVRIFTGAALPDGADTVLVQEEAAREGERLMLGGEGPAHRGRNVRARGLDFHDGDRLIAAGERLTPARIAVAATGGQGSLPVRRAVRVALAATGDELVPAGGPISGAQLPESNGVMLAAMLADLPVEIVDLGILPDRLDVLTEAFRSVEADLLVTTGGASVGDHDLVRPALLAAGGEIDFWRIALRPGKPMMAGRLGQALVLGLPGNPVSAFVTATLFVRPLIAHLAGAADPLPVTTHALLGEDLPANGGRTDYLRARLEDGRAYASTIQDSSMLLTLARSTCLILRPAHAPAARAGESAEILVIA
jgi:molybdopterin molybdotransferase